MTRYVCSPPLGRYGDTFPVPVLLFPRYLRCSLVTLPGRYGALFHVVTFTTVYYVVVVRYVRSISILRWVVVTHVVGDSLRSHLLVVVDSGDLLICSCLASCHLHYTCTPTTPPLHLRYHYTRWCSHFVDLPLLITPDTTTYLPVTPSAFHRSFLFRYHSAFWNLRFWSLLVITFLELHSRYVPHVVDDRFTLGYRLLHVRYYVVTLRLYP